MKLTSRLVSGAVALALAGAAPAWAQGTPSGSQPASSGTARKVRKNHENPTVLKEVVVTGIRASMENALELERMSNTIQDSIVASDIGKLPDVTAIDALQRIPGVQILRNLGEGGGLLNIGGSVINSGYTIRGLPQAESTLNGREVFTATGSRVLDMSDIPSALLAGIDVYKDPTASQIAGGIAGTVNLRTHKPFDFHGLELEASAEGQYADMVGSTKPSFTALASDTWMTGIGKIGALLTVAYRNRAYREDWASNNSIGISTTAIPGETITYLPGVYNTTIVGHRTHTGFDAVFQWQPTRDFQAYAEASTEMAKTNQNQYDFFSQQYGGPIVPGSISLFPGTTDVRAISWNNALVSTVGAKYFYNNIDRQFALHAKWTPIPWTIVADLSHTGATERLVNPAVDIGGFAPTLTQLNSVAGVPQSFVTGLNMTNLSSFGGTASNYQSYMYDTEQHFRGSENAATLDATYALPKGFLDSIQTGVQIADRKDAFYQWQTFGALTTAAIQNNANWFSVVPGSPFFATTESSPVEPQYIAFDPGQLQFNLPGVTSALGIPAPVDNGSADYKIDERTYAGYLQLNFSAHVGVPMTGNIGVRVVRHEDFMNGELGYGSTFTPATFANGETDPLPSLNLLFKLTRKLNLRLAASQAISYPDFSQIRPSISLLQAQGAASGGNPTLKPTKADQFDASLAYYFASGSVVSGDIFYKKLSNFILSETQQSAFTLGSVTYNLTGAVNGGSGTIKGAEFDYQQFFTSLPGWLSGLGTEINYTYIEATAPTAVAGTTTTLPGLSKNSYNLIGIYEKGPVSVRVAYNWRSQFYSSLYTGSSGALSANPIYTKQYGWLDASASYHVNHWLTIYAQGSNLLRTRISQFYGRATLPEARIINDRQAIVGFRVTY